MDETLAGVAVKNVNTLPFAGHCAGGHANSGGLSGVRADAP